MQKPVIMLPDYQNSIVSLANSILKFYQVPMHHNSSSVLDTELTDDLKHVFLIVLDGMGISTLEKHLKETDVLRKFLKDQISSVFPPTTVAATNAILSGKTPLEMGYLGWVQYFEQEDIHDIVFLNKDFYDEKKEIAVNLKEKYLNYATILDQITKFRSDIEAIEIYPSFRENGYESFSLQLQKAKEIAAQNNATFSYMYWTDPDMTQHEFGVNSEETRVVMEQLNKDFTDFITCLNEESIVIVTADHGLIDVESVFLLEYPQLVECFRINPSVEPRATVFYIKEECKQQFENLFYHHFERKDFCLLTKDELLAMHYLGEGIPHPMIENFVGDYMAIATDSKMFSLHPDSFFKAHHAGLTTCEMLVPLIIYKKEKQLD